MGWTFSKIIKNNNVHFFLELLLILVCSLVTDQYENYIIMYVWLNYMLLKGKPSALYSTHQQSLHSNFRTPSASEKKLQLWEIISLNLQLQSSRNCRMFVEPTHFIFLWVWASYMDLQQPFNKIHTSFKQCGSLWLHCVGVFGEELQF